MTSEAILRIETALAAKHNVNATAADILTDLTLLLGVDQIERLLDAGMTDTGSDLNLTPLRLTGRIRTFVAAQRCIDAELSQACNGGQN